MTTDAKPSPRVTYELISQVLNVPAIRLESAAKLLHVGDAVGLPFSPSVIAILHSYVHLLKYAAPEVGLLVVQRAVMSIKDGLTGVAVVNRNVVIFNETALWNLENGDPVEPEAIADVLEQHGLDLMACAKAIIKTAEQFNAAQEQRRRAGGRSAGAPGPFGAVAPVAPSAPGGPGPA